MPDESFIAKAKRIDPAWWGAAAAVAGAGAVIVPTHRILAAGAGAGVVLWLAWSRLPCCAACGDAAKATAETSAAPQAQAFAQPAPTTQTIYAPAPQLTPAPTPASIQATIDAMLVDAKTYRPATVEPAQLGPVSAYTAPMPVEPARAVESYGTVTPAPVVAQVVNGLVMLPSVAVGSAVSIARDGSFSTGAPKVAVDKPAPATQSLLRLLG